MVSVKVVVRGKERGTSVEKNFPGSSGNRVGASLRTFGEKEERRKGRHGGGSTPGGEVI